jgi:hypothetical protein
MVDVPAGGLVLVVVLLLVKAPPSMTKCRECVKKPPAYLV